MTQHDLLDETGEQHAVEVVLGTNLFHGLACGGAPRVLIGLRQIANQQRPITTQSTNQRSATQHYYADWIEQCFMSPPTQYRLYGRQFLQVKRPNQQYQSTEGTYRQIKHTISSHKHNTQQIP